MTNALITQNFSTTDGLNIKIEQYPNHSIYTIVDQDAKKFKVTVKEQGKKFIIQPHFSYPYAEQDGYSIYSEKDRQLRHLGNIVMDKIVGNDNDAETIAIEAVRKIAKLTPQYLTFLNEMQNAIFEIKSNPEAERIPTLLNIMKVQLEYLMSIYS